MDDDTLNIAKEQVTQGGSVVVGIIGDDRSLIDAAKEAALLWGIHVPD